MGRAAAAVPRTDSLGLAVVVDLLHVLSSFVFSDLFTLYRKNRCEVTRTHEGLPHGIAARFFGGNLGLFFRYALFHPVSTAVIGCDDVGQLEENIGIASDLSPLTAAEMDLLSESLSPVARNVMYYKP
jgi:hypothetical protein